MGVGAGVREAPASKSSEWPEPYVEQNARFVLDGPLYAFFNHNSETWDSEKTTLGATHRLAKMISDHDIPVISNVEDFTGDEPVDNHFLSSEDISCAVKSPDGRHRLLFPRLKGVMLSGGYLEHCLSRAIQDIYRGMYLYKPYRPQEPVRLYLVADAVYVSGSDINPVLNRKPSSEAAEQAPFPLLRAMALMSDHALAAYLGDKVLNMRSAWHSHDGPGEPFDPKEAHIRIFRGDYQIYATGDGWVAVDVILLDTAMLKERLPQIVRWAGRRPRQPSSLPPRAPRSGLQYSAPR